MFVERGAGLFGNERDPGVVDLPHDLLKVGVEVNAHGVGEDVDAGARADVRGGDAADGLGSGAPAILAGSAGCLADGFAGALLGVEGWGRLGGVGDGGKDGRRGPGRLHGRQRGGLGRLLYGRSGRGLCRLWSLRQFAGFGGPAHGFERLLIDLGTCCGGWLYGRFGALRSMGKLLFEVAGKAQIGEFALLEDLGWIDEARLVKEHARAVEEEPAEDDVDEERDVDGLAESRFCAFVVEGVEKMDELVLFKLPEATGAYFDWLGWFNRIRGGLEGGSGHEVYGVRRSKRVESLWFARKPFLDSFSHRLGDVVGLCFEGGLRLVGERANAGPSASLRVTRVARVWCGR